MKQYLKYLITVLIASVVMFEAVVFGILLIPRGVFHSSFQSVVVDKYRILQNTNEPKIIICAGSSASFGLNQEMLAEASGYQVVNLGLHAGFGQMFTVELSKENINPGDIVLLGFEYGWEIGIDNFGQHLIMSGIDDNIDMYKHIPVSQWKDFIGYLFQYAEKKYTYTDVSGLYSREAFNSETAQMTMYRESSMDYDENAARYGNVDLTGVRVSEETCRYLREYKAYVESRGASVYFVSPPVLKKAVVCDYSCFEDIKQQIEEEIGIHYISNPEDYFFEERLMADAIFHCSSEGETVRTQLLIEDLHRAGLIE